MTPTYDALARRAAEALASYREIAYALIDDELIIRAASPNFLALLGAGAEVAPEDAHLTTVLWEFIGLEEALKDVARGDLPALHLPQINRVADDEQVHYLTYLVVPFDPADTSQGLLFVAEDTTYYGRLEQGLVQDRNELRLMRNALIRANDELRRINRLKSLFLSMAAHDLRSPLTVVDGYSQLLLEQLPPEGSAEQRRMLLSMSIQSDSMARLITDLLDLDRIEQGRLVINPSQCDLNDIARDSIGLHQLMLEQRSQVLEPELSAEPLPIWADADRLLQVVNNLIANAIKYTGKGGRIRVRSERRDGRAVLAVLDSGKGMTADEVSHVFEVYYRTEKAKRSQIQGSGLGLFIVKSIVEAHGGVVAVDSQPGQGTRFEIGVPLREGDADG